MPGSSFKSAGPAEFITGSDGVVSKVGIEMEEGVGKIWFDRI